MKGFSAEATVWMCYGIPVIQCNCPVSVLLEHSKYEGMESVLLRQVKNNLHLIFTKSMHTVTEILRNINQELDILFKRRN